MRGGGDTVQLERMYFARLDKSDKKEKTSLFIICIHKKVQIKQVQNKKRGIENAKNKPRYAVSRNYSAPL